MREVRASTPRSPCLVLFLFLLVGCASSRGFDTIDIPPAGATTGGSVAYGPITGFVQIPKGGRPGSTSSQRPRFDEVDVTESLSLQAPIRLSWDGHLLYADVRLTQFSSRTVLDDRLVSHDDLFPAGSAVRTEVGLDRYRIGYGYLLETEFSDGSILRYGPTAGVALLDFSYRLESGGTDAAREFLLGSPQLGVEARWSPPGPFSLRGTVAGTMPITGTLQMSSIEIEGTLMMFGDEDRGGRLLLGLGFEWLEYEDHQTRPNHIRARIGPVATVGFEITF